MSLSNKVLFQEISSQIPFSFLRLAVGLLGHTFEALVVSEELVTRVKKSCFSRGSRGNSLGKINAWLLFQWGIAACPSERRVSHYIIQKPLDPMDCHSTSRCPSNPAKSLADSFFQLILPVSGVISRTLRSFNQFSVFGHVAMLSVAHHEPNL